MSLLSERVTTEQVYLAHNRRRRTVTCLIAVLSVLLLASGFLLFGIGFAQVEGGSMFPTFRQGDMVIFLRTPRAYQRQDIVLFLPGGDGPALIKRVIAVAGDTVDVDGATGRVTVNGRVLEEPYAVGSGRHEDSEKFPLVVPNGEVFVLGDNRDVALDSRNTELGTIPITYIRGVVLTVLRTSF